MIYIRDDDIIFNAIWRHQLFLKYKIFVDIGIITSRPFPVRWIKKHIKMYEVCNHSHSHKIDKLINWDSKKQREDLEKANNIIYKKIGIKPRYFIPPAGRYNEQLLEVCESIGLSLHPSYTMAKKNPEKYYSAHKVDIIGKNEGWYICHTASRQPSYSRLKKNLQYLYENRLTRFWD